MALLRVMEKRCALPTENCITRFGGLPGIGLVSAGHGILQCPTIGKIGVTMSEAERTGRPPPRPSGSPEGRHFVGWRRKVRAPEGAMVGNAHRP